MCRAALSTGQRMGMGKSFWAVSGVSTNISTGASIQNHGVQRTPYLANALADGLDLFAVGDVAGRQQNLSRVTFIQGFEWPQRAGS